MQDLKAMMMAVDLEGIRKALSDNPALANEGIPFDEENQTKAHPLHRISDGVCHHIYSDEQAAAIAAIFLESGADVNGNVQEVQKDTPLTAACSLQADQVALLLLDHGADIRHQGCHGGTALHWAAWTGRDVLVKRLIQEGADIHQRCISFTGTPLLWAVHGYKFGGEENRHHQIACVQLLLDAGADKYAPNIDNSPALDFLGPEDEEMARLVR